MNKTFISYSRKDLKFAKRLLNALHNRGLDPWFDFEDLQPAQAWHSGLLLGVQLADNFLCLISPDFAESQYCKEELESALRHEKRLIPVLRRDTSPHLLQPALRELQWIFSRAEDDFELAVTKIVQVIEAPLNFNPLNDRIKAVLWVLDSQGKREISLQRESYIIGRNPSEIYSSGSIFVYDSRNISRRHLKLFFEDGSWKVQDLSKNGIAVFPPCPGNRLQNNTKIFLGKSCLIYKELELPKFPEPDEHPTFTGEEC